MTATLVQKSENNTATAVSTVVLTGVTGGNTIYVTAEDFDTWAIVSLADDKGNTYTQDLSARNYLNTANIKYYRANNVTGGTVTITLTRAGGGTARWYVEEVSGVANASPEVTMTGASGGYNATPTIAYTTVSANSYARTYSTTGSGIVTTDGTHTAHSSSGNRPGMASYLVDTGVVGVKSGTVTLSSAQWWTMSGLVYAAAPTGPTVSTITGTTATEASAVVFTVTMSGTGGLTDAYSWSGTATSADYTQTLTDGMFTTTGGSGSVTVSGGNIVVPSAVTAFTVTVPTTTDTLDEADETIRLVFGGVTASSGTITDDDSAPTISVDDVTESAGSCIFTVSLSAASGKSITVDYATANGTSTAGVDYTAASGTLTFAAGETTKTVTVTVP